MKLVRKAPEKVVIPEPEKPDPIPQIVSAINAQTASNRAMLSGVVSATKAAIESAFKHDEKPSEPPRRATNFHAYNLKRDASGRLLTFDIEVRD